MCIDEFAFHTISCMGLHFKTDVPTGKRWWLWTEIRSWHLFVSMSTLALKYVMTISSLSTRTNMWHSNSCFLQLTSVLQWPSYYAFYNGASMLYIFLSRTTLWWHRTRSERLGSGCCSSHTAFFWERFFREIVKCHEWLAHPIILSCWTSKFWRQLSQLYSFRKYNLMS